MKLLLQKKTSCLSGDHNRLLMQPVCEPGTRPVRNRLPKRIWVEIVLGLMSAALLSLTILLPDWMEVLFGLAPDAGDGSAEWGVALLWATVSVLMFGFAGRTWRKHLRLVRSA
ncbi:hypothetical protein HDF09_002771 [Edaphobacter lichenicola]|uniref:Uncharacterized protein n=1 Tax=Tunturiibacter empetritectus TaxID=3069691 RepID=A0A7W8MSQ5_9BACT|nr:hypothetical protein [Edaphobacter lichenicola]